MSQKRRAGEITEWRRGVGLRSPTSGAEFPLRDGLFSVWRGLLPLQTACRCVCRGGRIGHVRYRISRHVRYRPGCFDFHAGGSIVGQMAFGLAPRSAGRMKKPLVKVRLASGFSYVGHQGSVDGADLVDEAASCRDCAAGSGRRRTLCRRSCRRTGDQIALFSKIPIRAVLFHLAIEHSKIATSCYFAGIHASSFVQIPKIPLF